MWARTTTCSAHGWAPTLLPSEVAGGRAWRLHMLRCWGCADCLQPLLVVLCECASPKDQGQDGVMDPEVQRSVSQHPSITLFRSMHPPSPNLVGSTEALQSAEVGIITHLSNSSTAYLTELLQPPTERNLASE